MLPSIYHASTEQTATVRPDLTFYASLELSRATWLVTCLLPEKDRMSKYSTPGGDGGALLGLLERMRARAQQLTGRPAKVVMIPAGPKTHGHFTHFYAEMWKPHLIEFMKTLGGPLQAAACIPSRP